MKLKEEDNKNGKSKNKLTKGEIIEKLRICLCDNHKILTHSKRLVQNYLLLNKIPWTKLKVPVDLIIPVFLRLFHNEKERLKIQRGISYFPTIEECLLISHIFNPLTVFIPKKFSFSRKVL